MGILLKYSFTRWVLMAVEVAVFVALVIWVSKTYMAEVVSTHPSVGTLQLAARLDPGNSEHHLGLARLFEYNLADVDPNRAIEHLKRATELNPHDPRTWLDLGAALEFQGKISEAEACLRHVDFLAPNLPHFQWAIGNFLLLHGNVEEAFKHFKVVLTGSSQYNSVIFNLAWKASGEANKNLDELIPNHVGVEFDYLNYLLTQKRYVEAQSVWKRIVESPEVFSPAQASAYIDSLIETHRPSEAYQIWMDLRKKGLIKPTYEQTERNLIVNGDFEEELLNMGFDWRIIGIGEVYTGLDDSTYRSPGHALLIQFLGKQNVAYRHVYQFVRVAPARSYQLRCFMRTEGITTDSGPRLEVHDAYDPAALDKFSEALTGTLGWTLLTLDFTTGVKTNLIVVDIARLPSRKFDNKIAGKVWVDDLSLNASPGEVAHARKQAGH